jgi:predicted nucleic acid-binding Zn ribbon protein
MRRLGRHDAEPVPLAEAVAAVGRQLGFPEPDVFSTLSAEWPAIVGEQLAPHTSVRSLRDGVCTVEADGPGWATQLRYAQHQLVERAAECCGAGVVTSFRTVVKHP